MNPRFKEVYWGCVTMCVCVLTGVVCHFIQSQEGVGRSEAEKTRNFLGNQLHAGFQDLQGTVAAGMGQISNHLTNIEGIADYQLTQYRTETLKTINGLGNRTITEVNSTLNSNLQPLKIGIPPLLGQIQATFAQVNETIGENRKDVYGLIRDLRLTAAETGRTMVYVRQSAPNYLKTGQELADYLKGMAADTKVMTGVIKTRVEQLNKPMTKKQKAILILQLAALGGRAIAPFL